jgi:hypothetical protein
MIIKPMPVIVEAKFSLLFQDRSYKCRGDKQDSSNGESRILFHLNNFRLFYSKEHLSSEKINCYENIFPPRFLGSMALVAPFASLLKSNTIFAQKKECLYIMFISG